MATQIGSSNLFLNQAIETKVYKSINQTNVDTSFSGYNSNSTKEIASDKIPRAELLNLTQNDIKTSVLTADISDEKGLELDDAIEVVAKFMQLSTQNVNFEKDEKSAKTVIRVFDTESKDLIKQFPSEEVINIANKILELRQDIGIQTGMFLDEKV
jgi:flagellar protein FlaG